MGICENEESSGIPRTAQDGGRYILCRLIHIGFWDWSEVFVYLYLIFGFEIVGWKKQTSNFSGVDNLPCPPIICKRSTNMTGL